MKTHATPTDDCIDAAGHIEIYARTNSDGQSELVFYNSDDTDEWINATRASTVELEDYR